MLRPISRTQEEHLGERISHAVYSLQVLNLDLYISAETSNQYNDKRAYEVAVRTYQKITEVMQQLIYALPKDQREFELSHVKDFAVLPPLWIEDSIRPESRKDYELVPAIEESDIEF